MEISKTVIRTQASYNYQVASMEVEVQNYTEEELQNYSQYLVDTCTKLVKDISSAVGPTHTQVQQNKPVVQTQVQRPVQNSYQTTQVQQSPKQPNYKVPLQTTPIKYASEKQIQYIRGLGYTGDVNGMTFVDILLVITRSADAGFQLPMIIDYNFTDVYLYKVDVIQQYIEWCKKNEIKESNAHKVLSYIQDVEVEKNEKEDKE